MTGMVCQLVTLLTCSLLPVAVFAATSGTFTALSFNVAGLPQILQDNSVPGDKTDNTALIGTKFAQFAFDIIHVQEDFNYHATLYVNDNHPFRTATSGGVPFGSGLNTLANFPWVDLERVKWDVCSDASENDCLTPKAFTFMRVQVDEGVYVDAYNLHTDAGTESDDETARTSNIQQVADYIDTWSVGNAVLVFGDTNSRYTRTADNIALFTTQNGLTDAFVQRVLGGVPPTVESVCDNPAQSPTCETVDKFFYRGSRLVSLNATSFKYDSESFLQPNGSILSDHNPILVSLDWAASNLIRQSNFFGGPHGTWFSDTPQLPSSPNPAGATLLLRGGNRVDSVGIALSDGTTFTHGGVGGSPTSLVLGSDEFINSVQLCEDKFNDHTRIFFFEATTSTRRTVSAGKTTSDCVTFVPPEDGWGLIGFVGQDGDEVDQLALLWAPVV